MKLPRLPFFFAFCLTLAFVSCKKDEIIQPMPTPIIKGCTDANALNWDPIANEDNGTCEYPNSYIPTTPGNNWKLSDEISVIFQTVQVDLDFTMIKDTFFNRKLWTIQEEAVVAAGFGGRTDRYGYHVDTYGDVHRIQLNADSLVETLFLDYPLELGKKWWATDAQETECEVTSQSVLTVPAGTFSNVFAVQYTQVDNGFSTVLYFAQDVGLIRADISEEVQGFAVDLEAELQSYTLN